MGGGGENACHFKGILVIRLCVWVLWVVGKVVFVCVVGSEIRNLGIFIWYGIFVHHVRRRGLCLRAIYFQGIY